ncbi:hypothetical protein ECZC10_54680 [Escherichia coli]|nr:hypothetical protein ECZC10_54680 [Escherichia coli]
MNVNFDKLSLEVQNAVLVKFGTCENITVDMVISAQELLQEDVATFDGHIVEALMKTPELTLCIRNANCSLSDGLNINVSLVQMARNSG